MVTHRIVADFVDYKVGDDGTVWSKKTGTWVQCKPIKADKYGHLRVNLHRDGRKFARFVHRLVLEAFVGPCPIGMECRHFPDRNPANNALSNLRWSTHQENVDDMVKDGTKAVGDRNGSRTKPEQLARGDKHYTRLKPELIPRGETRGQTKLTDTKVKKIRRAYATGKFTQQELADEAGVSRKTVGNIVNRKKWTHI